MLKSPLRATSPRVPSPEHIRPPRAGGCRLLRLPCWDPHSGKGRRAAKVGSRAGGAPSRTVSGGPSQQRNCSPPRSSRRPRCSPECDSQRPPGPSLEAHSWDGGARCPGRAQRCKERVWRAGYTAQVTYPSALSGGLGGSGRRELHSADVGSADLRRQDGDTRKPKANERTWRVRLP